MSQVITVKIQNWYSDGHESFTEALIEAPSDLAGDAVDEWFEDVVFDHTGDGHGVGRKLGSVYTATVIACDDEALLGREYEWVD